MPSASIPGEYTRAATPSGAFQPRIFRVQGTDYYGDEALDAAATHTDARLAEVAGMGFDGVWLHAELRELAPTSLYQAYVQQVAERRASLRRAAQRARTHGLGIWLYLNEPRGYPQSHPFWAEHPECRGQPASDTAIAWRRGKEWFQVYSMCLSTAAIRGFLRDATRELFQAVPELAGAFVITASEHPTHCYSHLGRIPSRQLDCPRCRDRSPLDMTVEVARAMQDGLNAAGTGAQLAMWTWSWDTLAPDPQTPLMQALPPEVALLSDFERGEPVERAGKRILVDEYSFAITGPSERFRAYAAASSVLPVWAKLQVNATHELATVPNIPAVGTLYEKVAAARAAGVRGVLASWLFAISPTLNSFATGRLLAHDGPLPPRDTFLRTLARDYFGSATGDGEVAQVVDAWNRFGDAMRRFPSTIAFLYRAPTNYAPAYPWTVERAHTPMARSWTSEPWGDDLEQAATPFTLAEIATLLGDVATVWETGMVSYRRALASLAAPAALVSPVSPVSPALATEPQVHARQELDVAEACGLFFRSCAGRYAFAAAVARQAPATELRAIIQEEVATCEAVLPLVRRDGRIGWQDDTRRQIVSPAAVEAKLAGLHELLATLAS